MILWQIYSGNYVPNFTRIARSLWEILCKIFWSYFFRTHCLQLAILDCLCYRSRIVHSIRQENKEFC